MRSKEEIAFRLRQEARNLWLWRARARNLPDRPAPLPLLPPPYAVIAALHGSEFEQQVLALASDIRQHRFLIFGQVLDTGPVIDWRRDYFHNRTSGAQYFRLVPYLDFDRVGDHKYIWELNRHQHLVVLAQAFLFTADDALLKEIWTQLESWFAANPFAQGINWASALEVAFRAFSWVWIDHLVGNLMPDGLRRQFIAGLYEHGLFIENNLSVYFSPNTHLLGEAVALHALGRLYPAWPRTSRWTRAGSAIALEQMARQVQEDGSHFEQSTYYHVYAFDMFLFHAVLADVGAEYRRKLALMADFLDALLGPQRAIPFLGDDDGGRFFHPYGPRDRFGRASLATASVLLSKPFCCQAADFDEQAIWWLGPDARRQEPTAFHPVSVFFPDTGLAVMNTESIQVIADAGPFGPGGAGHSHADALSMIVHQNGDPLLLDAGTYRYLAEPPWRDLFRGVTSHNTLHVPGADQAHAAGTFRWEDKPAVRCRQWHTDPSQDFLDGECRTSRYTHRRRVLFRKSQWILTIDETDAEQAEVRWHLGDAARLVFPAGTEIRQEQGWRSSVYGSKEPCRMAVSPCGTGHPGVALLDLRPAGDSLTLEVTLQNGAVRVEVREGGPVQVLFPPDGLPVVTG